MKTKKVFSLGSQKYVEYQKLTAFESVSIAAVFVLSITAGMLVGINWYLV